jgi:5'-methylthioadenosine phosphorylase
VKAHRGGTYLVHGRAGVLDCGGVECLSLLGHGHHRHDKLQEAKLAREAEICYATLALVTDYDCWHPGHDAVSIETVLSI